MCGRERDHLVVELLVVGDPVLPLYLELLLELLILLSSECVFLFERLDFVDNFIHCRHG